MKKVVFTICFFWFIATLSGQQIDSSRIQKIDSLLKANKLYCSKLQYQDAINAIELAEKWASTEFGEHSAKFAKALFLHGRTQYLFGHLKSAEELYLKALKIQKIDPGMDHPDYAWTLNNLGGLYWKLTDYINSEKYYLEACEKRKSILGDQHPDYAWSLHNLAAMYVDIGYYEKAENLYQLAKHIREKNPGIKSIDYAYSLNHLALLYRHLGNYQKSEQYHLEALKLFTTLHQSDHPDIAWALGNLSELYELLGNYDRAEEYALRTVEIRKKLFGDANSDYAFALTSLGRIYTSKLEFDKAEAMILEAKGIRARVYGTGNADELQSLMNLAVLYNSKDDSINAVKYWNLCYKLANSLRDKEPVLFGDVLINLAYFYLDAQNLAQAEFFFTKAKVQIESIFGKSHPQYAEVLDGLTALHFEKKDFELASSLGRLSFQIHKTQILSAQNYMSEQELGFYLKKFLYKLNLDYQLAEKYTPYLDIAFNNTLLYKSFLLEKTKQLSHVSKDDSTGLLLLKDWRSYKRALGKELEKPVQNRGIVKKLVDDINELEKKLASKKIQTASSQHEVDWKEVWKNLSPKSAVIECISYENYFDHSSESKNYAALVLSADTPAIHFVPLCTENSLKKLLSNTAVRKADYVNQLYSLPERGARALMESKETLYNLICSPLERKIAGHQTIFYSPVGYLHRINLDAIPIQNSQTMADKYQIINLQSSRQMVIKSDKGSSTDEAILFGGIDYDSSNKITSGELSFANRSAQVKDEKIDSLTPSGGWNYLPGTALETENIQRILLSSNIATRLYKGSDATEESMKKLGSDGIKSPRIVHIASHGFFEPEESVGHATGTSLARQNNILINEDPMFRSGLILAGANEKSRLNIYDEELEDGIIHSYEISQLYLAGTELVVLSACETGLGDIDDNEGVYGLQRAFKIAGVKYIIMSLWQVPDKQTSLLMTTFYKKWLENKMSIPDAFHAAQKELRDIGLDPYQWAGFVLVE